MREINLNDYTCSVPFSSLEIHNDDFFVCCPSWLPKRFKRTDYTLESVWKSKELEDIRSSLLDGSFKYCDKTQCPFLSKLLNDGVVSNPITKKSDFQYEGVTSKFDGPEVLMLNFDNTCNYKCPSCRVDLIVLDSKGIKNVEKTIDEIDEHYSKDVVKLYITGSGDPFVSVGFRNYLRNFKPEKYPKLKGIHLHTNASMWNEKMWESMPNIHKYVKSCEISIDAGTKSTYENETRLGGSWDTLIENLKFINTIPKLKTIKTSFVVQDTNYKEMSEFYNLIRNIFGLKSQIFFGKITNWGTYTEEKFTIKKVWDKSHPEHNKFVKEFNNVCKNNGVLHNMYEFIENKKTLL